MLQIVTKMYFREDAPVSTWPHRMVLYTNCNFLTADPIELPVGVLVPSTPSSAVSAVMASVTEHLETARSEEQLVTQIATGGRELIDDLAVVLSFGLNAVFSRDLDLVRRLVPDAVGTDRKTRATHLFGRTFEAGRFVPPTELDELRAFMTQLLALRRPQYEAVMRAFRRIVGAVQRAEDDPTLAYVDIVAALESLSVDVEGVPITWDRMDDRKRRIIDKALEPLGSETADRVRTAVIEAERLGIKAKFVAFVLNNVSAAFYRSEAAGQPRPIRGADLERLVKHTYDVRSMSMHRLRELQPEAVLLGNQSETVRPPDGYLAFSHRGLARLARHVVKNYISTAPTGVDPDFDWRGYLPGRVRLPFAPQYWVSNPDGFDHQSVERWFAGYLQLVVGALAGRPAMPDITPILERIEALASGSRTGSGRTLMMAAYVLWHYVMAPEFHRPDAAKLLPRYESKLQAPGLAAFVTGLLLQGSPEWTAEDWQALATERHSERLMRRQLELPPTVDAALQVIAAQQLAAAGHAEEARQHAAYAVEELPGDETLIAWEAAFTEHGRAEIDTWALAVQPEAPGADAAEPDATADHSSSDNAPEP